MTAEPHRKPIPVPTPETQPYWDKAREHELWIQRCLACAHVFFYPRPHCPHCLSDNLEWFKASGRGTLYSYVINHRPAPGFEDEAPYAIAIVQMEEGPRMMTNIVGGREHAREPGPRHGVGGHLRRRPAGRHHTQMEACRGLRRSELLSPTSAGES